MPLESDANSLDHLSDPLVSPKVAHGGATLGQVREFATEIEKGTRRERQHAKRIVELWNKRAQRGLRPSFYPTIGTMLAANTPILDVLCPACQTVGSVDIRSLDRRPGMVISGLIPYLSCRMCCPNPPFAKLIGLRPLGRT